MPDFDKFVELMFSSKHQRPIFVDFNATSKSHTLRLALACYLCHGGSDTELVKLSAALADTIKNCGVSSVPGAISVLLDHSCQAFATILKKSEVVRQLFNSGKGGLTWREIVEFATASSNALARKSLGMAAGLMVGGEEVQVRGGGANIASTLCPRCRNSSLTLSLRRRMRSLSRASLGDWGWARRR